MMTNGWQVVPLKEIAKPISRSVPVEAGTEYRTIGVKWWGMGAYERETIDGSRTAAKTLSIVREGDLIINKIWVRHGSVAIANKDVDGCAGSGEFPTFELDLNRIEPRWIHWQTKMKSFWEKCDSLSRGTSGKNRIKPELFLTINIPLPTLDEQRRVLERVETLAAHITKVQYLQEETIEQAERLSQSILRDIFSQENNWKSQKLDEIAPINMGQSPSGDSYNFDKEGAPLLNGPTEFGEKHPTPRQWTTSPSKFCKAGDILICVRGATTGKMNWADQEYCIGRGLAALSVDTTKYLPEYVYYFVRTQTQEILSRTAGSTFPNLPGEKLKTLPIPVPPLDEQRRIVAYLDSVQARLASLRELQSATGEELSALLPSVLDNAFKGEL
jgi:type I restriction enzyme S subunit